MKRTNIRAPLCAATPQQSCSGRAVLTQHPQRTRSGQVRPEKVWAGHQPFPESDKTTPR